MENIPCWYELSWRQAPPAIILRIHRDFIRDFLAAIKAPPAEWPIVKDFIKEFGLTNFSADFGKDIGFSEIFKNEGEKDDFSEFAVKIPRIRKKTKWNCSYCKGSGKDEFMPEIREKCAFCDGSGKKIIVDFRITTAISASFTVFTSMLGYGNSRTTASVPQLLTLQTITKNDSGALSGEVSIPLKNWLASRAEHNLPEVTQATQTAYYRMFSRAYRFGNHYFSASSGERGEFIIHCPGNACSINPTNWYEHKGEGYNFGCHNVDSEAQQITLIVGLAALHDKARKEIQTY